MQIARRQFFWPGMKRDLQNLIAGCTTCLRFKRGQTRPVPITTAKLSPGFMSIVSVDLVGPFRPSSAGHTYSRYVNTGPGW